MTTITAGSCFGFGTTDNGVAYKDTTATTGTIAGVTFTW